MIGELPRSLDVNGKEYEIRTDFRDVLKIVCAYSDPELEEKEKAYITLRILYPDFDDMPEEDYEEAFEAAIRFMDYGQTDDGKPSPKVMDWEQDENILFPAVNKVAGFETRTADYIHWWTFMGYFMEINKGVYANVLSLRLKKATGKPLEKWEREYWNANKGICILRPKLTEEQKAKKDKLNKLFD